MAAAAAAAAAAAHPTSVGCALFDRVHRPRVPVPNGSADACPCCIAIQSYGRWECAACTAPIPHRAILSSNDAAAFWLIAAVYPDEDMQIPAAISAFFTFLRDVCRITTSDVDIVTFMQHPVTASMADKLITQLYWNHDKLIGKPTDTVAMIVSAIIAER